MTTHEYTFDVKMFAAIRVKAASAAEARATLNDNVNLMDCNAGCWPNGDPILFMASMDGEADLLEVDGESV